MSENNEPSNVHYIHRLSAVVQQRIVGIFVLSAVLVIVGLVLIQIQSSHLLDDRIRYHAYLTNAQGVSTETLINISGIEVGKVSSIDITDDNRVHVQFFVYDRFQRLIRKDSTGALNKLSVIGNAAIIIKAGSHELPILPDNSTIPIEEPITIDELMAKLTPVITDLGDIVQNVSDIVEAIEPDKLKSSVADLSEMMVNLRLVSEQITTGKGLVGQLLFDKTLETEVTKTIRDIGPIVRDVHPIVKDIGLVVNKVESDMKLVESILIETDKRVKEIARLMPPVNQLANQSNEIADDIKTTTRVVSEEIHQLPDMVNKMQSLLYQTNRTLQNAQEVWPLNTVIPPTSKETLIKDQP